MSKLADILGDEYAWSMQQHDIIVTNGKASEFARRSKQQIKDLFLELIESVEPFTAKDGRAFLPLGELTKKVSKL